MSNAIFWTRAGDKLTVRMDKRKPVTVSGSLAVKLFYEIKSHEEDMTRDIAERIYDEANASQTLIQSVRNRVSELDIVQSMRKSGIKSIAYDDEENMVTFSDQPIKGAVGRHIARIVKRNGSDLDKINWSPVAKFFARLESNPTSAQTLFRWLTVNDFSIASDGRIVCYRGVDRNYLSVWQGAGGWTDSSGKTHHSYVTDVEGYESEKSLEYRPGSTVFMRREDCDPNVNVHCSTGIHFGTINYASKYGGATGRMMLCLVAPEDVVSVPNDDYRKARTCRIEVVGEIGDHQSPVEEPVVHFEEEEDEVVMLNGSSNDSSEVVDTKISTTSDNQDKE